MNKYKCGHKSDVIFMHENNILGLADWFDWKDSVGFDGDKSQCWNCWCEERSEKAKKMKLEPQEENQLSEENGINKHDIQ